MKFIINYIIKSSVNWFVTGTMELSLNSRKTLKKSSMTCCASPPDRWIGDWTSRMQTALELAEKWELMVCRVGLIRSIHDWNNFNHTRNLGAALPRAVMSLPAHDGTRRTTNIVLAESVNLSISFQEYVTIFIIFCPISFLFIVIS